MFEAFETDNIHLVMWVAVVNHGVNNGVLNFAARPISLDNPSPLTRAKRAKNFWLSIGFEQKAGISFPPLPTRPLFDRASDRSTRATMPLAPMAIAHSNLIFDFRQYLCGLL